VKNNIINYLNTLPQTIVSDSSLDKLIYGSDQGSELAILLVKSCTNKYTVFKIKIDIKCKYLPLCYDIIM